MPYAYQAISYAYCLVPYAYDQNPVFQICYGFSLLRDPSDPTCHSPIFIHVRSFYQLQLRYIQLLKSLTLLHLIPTISSIIIQFRSSIFHKFITYHFNQSQIQRFITTHYMLSHKTHQTMINPPYLSKSGNSVSFKLFLFSCSASLPFLFQPLLFSFFTWKPFSQKLGLFIIPTYILQ